MRGKRSPLPSRTPQQSCATCAMVEDLVEIAQADLQEGRFDDVSKALEIMQMYITGGLSVEVG